MYQVWEEDTDLACSGKRRRSACLGTSKHKEEDECSQSPDQVGL